MNSVHEIDNADSAVEKKVVESASLQSLPCRMMMDKSEKLRHRSLVNRLFAEGVSEYSYPLRMVWRRFDVEELGRIFRSHVPDRIGTVQFLITVPKKKQRHAVDRVLMRRRIREAYRLNREPLRTLPDGTHISMAFIYLSDKHYDYARIQECVRSLIAKMMQKISETPNLQEPSDE